VQSISAPVARAGSDQYIAPSASRRVVLDGSGSFDPQGGSLSFSWIQTGGPAVAMSGTTTAQPSFSCGPYNTATRLEFDLVVSTGGRTSAPSRVTITVGSPLAGPRVPQIPVPTVSFEPNGRLHIRLGTSQAFARFAIEGSSDLMHWQSEAVRYADKLGVVEATMQFGADASRTSAARFYRLHLQ
jgi:hypothetical protein